VDRTQFLSRSRSLLGEERVHPDAPLSGLTTFRVGGPADFLAEVGTIVELAELLSLAAVCAVPVTVIGGGSNVVVSDKGIRGLVIRPILTGITQPAPDTVRAEAGVTINGLVRWTVGRGLAGVEDWAGTPGTVGGAIYGNAHWAQRNIGDLVRRVMLASRAGVLSVVEAVDLEFSYDTSRLQRSGEIAVWAEIGVTRGEPGALREKARASLHYRKDTQPLAMPSAGCIFQNPDSLREVIPDGIPASAGALVDRAGMKGRAIGGARISERHANFIVNDGTATAADVRALAEAAREAVRERFGVTLRDEVVWLGA